MNYIVIGSGPNWKEFQFGMKQPGQLGLKIGPTGAPRAAWEMIRHWNAGNRQHAAEIVAFHRWDRQAPELVGLFAAHEWAQALKLASWRTS